MSDVLTVLRGAREMLEPPGAWIQGRYCNDDRTCFCILGALGVADRNDATDPSLRIIIALRRVLPPYHGDLISDWNDARGRTQADVLALLDQAIAAEESAS